MLVVFASHSCLQYYEPFESRKHHGVEGFVELWVLGLETPLGRHDGDDSEVLNGPIDERRSMTPRSIVR